MKRTAEGLLTILAAHLPAGCCEWAAVHRPDIGRYLVEATNDVMAAVAGTDPGEFAAAASHCIGVYRKAARIYEKELTMARQLTFSGEDLELMRQM